MIKLPEDLLIDEQQWLTCFNKVSHLLQNVTFIFEQCGFDYAGSACTKLVDVFRPFPRVVSLRSIDRSREREREISVHVADYTVRQLFYICTSKTYLLMVLFEQFHYGK